MSVRDTLNGLAIQSDCEEFGEFYPKTPEEILEEAFEDVRKRERERCLAICERVFKDPPKGIVSEATITAHLTAIRRVTREINDGPLK